MNNTINLLKILKTSKQKVRKQIQKTLEQIENGNKQFKNELLQYDSLIKLENEIYQHESYIKNLNDYFLLAYNEKSLFLQNMQFLDEENKVSEKGICATYIQETHCLAFIDYFFKLNQFQNLSAIDIAALLSCFSNIRVKDEVKIYDASKLLTHCELIDSVS